MVAAGSPAVAVKVTEAPGIEAVTAMLGPVGVRLLLARPLASVTAVPAPSEPLPDETVQVTVWPATGTPFCVTLTTKGAGSGVLMVPAWLLPETMAMASVGGETTRLKDVVRPRGLPVTVIAKVPAGVAAEVVMVSVVEQVGLQEVGVNAIVVPLGSPEPVKLTEAVKLTGCVKPACSVAVVVLAPDAPAVTITPPEFVKV